MKDTVIFDLDDTLTIVGDRKKYLEQTPKNWDAFFEACDRDEPNHPIVLIWHQIYFHFDRACIITGRSESVRGKTVDWLNRNGITPEVLLMRAEGDFRPDSVVKLEMLESIGGPERVAFAVDDQPHMAEFWNSHGIPTLLLRGFR